MSSPQIFALGVTHRTMALRDRELLAMSAGEAEAFASALSAVPGVSEFVLLSTCNRLEVYGIGEDGRAIAAVAEAFVAFRPAAAERFLRARLELRGHAAVRHLLDVAVGLDSQMLGETEIFGQMKKAYASAQARGSAGPVLNRVFQKTFQAAKRARAESGVTEGAVSTANVAVDVARNVFGGLDQARVLLVGAGEIGTKAGRAFRSRGAAALTVSSRCPERTAAVALELEATALSFSEFRGRLADFDIVVCSTAAPEPIIGEAAVTAALRERGSRPMFFIDLSMPRNIDPAIVGLENTYLFNLEDLARITAENREARRREFERCSDYLEERANALWTQVQHGVSGMEHGSDPVPHAPCPMRTHAHAPCPMPQAI